MSSYDMSGLDKYTNKMIKRITQESPDMMKDFLNKQITGCKNEVVSKTPRAKKPKKHKKAKHLQDNWKTNVTVRNGNSSASLSNKSPHAHLIENGHMTKDGGWVEGKHMLETTITARQPRIDAAIDKLIDDIFDF